MLEGLVGVQLGPEGLEAGPGDLLFKPRGVAHAFWNSQDPPEALKPPDNPFRNVR